MRLNHHSANYTIKRLITRLCFAVASLSASLYGLAGQALAAGGKPATKLVNVADTRTLSGITKWIADVYNTDLWLYATVVVITMAALGLILGTAFDRIFMLFGIHLGKLEHHE